MMTRLRWNAQSPGPLRLTADPADTEQSSFDNEWLGQAVESAPSLESSGVDEMYCRPKLQVKYHFAKVWDILDKNDEPYTMTDILDRQQAGILEDELQIKLDTRLNGKLVHIAGYSMESVHEACERLEVMLAARVSILKTAFQE